jgi:hypothetical protein
MQHVDVRFVSGGRFLVATRWADKDQTLRLRFIVLDLHSSRVVEAHYGIEQRRRLFSTAGGGTKYVLMFMIVPPFLLFLWSSCMENSRNIAWSRNRDGEDR